MFDTLIETWARNNGPSTLTNFRYRFLPPLLNIKEAIKILFDNGQIDDETASGLMFAFRELLDCPMFPPCITYHPFSCDTKPGAL